MEAARDGKTNFKIKFLQFETANETTTTLALLTTPTQCSENRCQTGICALFMWTWSENVILNYLCGTVQWCNCNVCMSVFWCSLEFQFFLSGATALTRFIRWLFLFAHTLSINSAKCNFRSRGLFIIQFFLFFLLPLLSELVCMYVGSRALKSC